ncbi:MAG: cytochrome c-type biogenesis CcmF C-terminal domain-containing protein [Bacillota bacterium]
MESFLSRESSFLLNNLLLVGAAFAVFWGTIFPLVSELVRGIKITVGPPFFNQVAGPILLAIVLLMGICPLIAWQRSSLEKLRDNFLRPFLAALVFGLLLYLLGMRIIFPIIGFAVSFFVFITIVKEFYLGTRVRSRLTGEPLPTAFWRLISRNRRRYGGYLVHLGMVFIALAVTGTMGLKTETVQTVSRGRTNSHC